MVKTAFDGWFIKLNFSESLAVKPKFEAQDAHFPGKQLALYYSIIEANVPKYINLFHDDTIHKSFSVHQVLPAIIISKKIGNHAIITKSENAQIHSIKANLGI